MSRIAALILLFLPACALEAGEEVANESRAVDVSEEDKPCLQCHPPGLVHAPAPGDIVHTRGPEKVAPAEATVGDVDGQARGPVMIHAPRLGEVVPILPDDRVPRIDNQTRSNAR